MLRKESQAKYPLLPKCLEPSGSAIYLVPGIGLACASAGWETLWPSSYCPGRFVRPICNGRLSGVHDSQLTPSVVRGPWAVARGPTGGHTRVDEVTDAGPAGSVCV
jgi:hypothetical protein